MNYFKYFQPFFKQSFNFESVMKRNRLQGGYWSFQLAENRSQISPKSSKRSKKASDSHLIDSNYKIELTILNLFSMIKHIPSEDYTK